MITQLWLRWKRFAQRVADIQARIILTLIYYLLLAPFGLLVKYLQDPLGMKRLRQTSCWASKANEEATMQNARRQY